MKDSDAMATSEAPASTVPAGSGMQPVPALGMCVECEDTQAVLKCLNCGDIFCALCYQWCALSYLCGVLCCIALAKLGLTGFMERSFVHVCMPTCLHAGSTEAAPGNRTQQIRLSLAVSR